VKFTCDDGDAFTTVLKDFASQNNVDGRYDATYKGSYSIKKRLARRP
jgi:hypothetical protein